MRLKKLSYKSLPFLASILAGLLFYFLGLRLNDDLKGLFYNISAAFLAIPCLYLFYELTQKYSNRKLNKEINDYLKMQVDREILSIINQLVKIVYEYDNQNFSLKEIFNFLNLKEDEIKSFVRHRKFLGFQVLKEWQISENNLHDLLKNSFILNKMENEQIISIIKLIKNIRSLEQIQKIKDLYIESTESTNDYKIVRGKEMNEENEKYPDRYLLLKKLEDEKFLVQDFGDFVKYKIVGLLQYYRLNEKYLDIYTESIFDLIKEINNWLDLTGKEFLIDTKMFKLGIKPAPDKL